MKSMKKDWYKKVWTMDIQNMSWIEDIKNEVDFLIDQLKLQGNEKILDLACGYGRHSLELARRGYDVTGIFPCLKRGGFGSLIPPVFFRI